MNIDEIDVKYCHIGNTENGNDHKGIITLATYIEASTVYYGVAFCSAKDRFNKKIGRTISYGRLNNTPVFVDLSPDEKTHKKIVNSILNDILSSNNYPSSIKVLLLDAIDWYSISDIKIDDKEIKNNHNYTKLVDGDKAWWLNGKLHREDGPAVEHLNGDKAWFVNGELHREDGPAIEYTNGTNEWYLNDKEYSEEEWKHRLSHKTSIEKFLKWF